MIPRSIRVRIVATFLAAVLALTGAQGFLLVQQRQVSAHIALLVDTWTPIAQVAERLERDEQRVADDLDRLLRREPGPPRFATAPIAVYSDHIRVALGEGRIHARQALRGELPPEDRAVLTRVLAHLDRVENLFRDFQVQADEISSHLADGQPEAARETGQALRRDASRLHEEVESLGRLVGDRQQQVAAATSTAQVRSDTVAAALTAVAFVFAVLAVGAVVVALRPIARLTTEVQRVAAGESGARVEVRGTGEIAVLAEEFNTMVRALEARDRSLRERAAEEARAKEALARSERLALVGQMLAQITHEVRNPLNALSLNTELLADELAALEEDHTADSWEILETVSSEIDRLTAVTEHYLQLARRPPARLESTDLVALVEDVVRLLEVELDQQGVVLQVSLSDPGAQLVDGNQLRQALLNVVRNAVEAGGRHLEISLLTLPDAVALRLTDDGPGMSDEERARACDPFYSTKASGTGLGLAITRQILEDHGGTVEIDAPPGKGTVLSLVLPVRSP